MRVTKDALRSDSVLLHTCKNRCQLECKQIDFTIVFN